MLSRYLSALLAALLLATIIQPAHAQTGAVGIGTTDPVAGLHIDWPESTTAQGVLRSGGSTGNPSVELRGNAKSPYLDFVETNVEYTPASAAVS